LDARAAARLLVHRSVRRPDVEPAARRQRRRRAAGRVGARRDQDDGGGGGVLRVEHARRDTGEMSSAQPRHVVDAHLHLWQYDPVEYAWIDCTISPLRCGVLPADAQGVMRRAGVDACIAVQARQTLEETRWLLELADSNPCIAGVVGWVDLEADDLGAQLEAFTSHARLVGVRHIVQAEPDDFLARPRFRRGIAQLARTGLSYDILVYARQIPAAGSFPA